MKNKQTKTLKNTPLPPSGVKNVDKKFTFHFIALYAFI